MLGDNRNVSCDSPVGQEPDEAPAVAASPPWGRDVIGQAEVFQHLAAQSVLVPRLMGIRVPDPPLLEGDLLLRPRRPGDVEWIVRGCTDPEVPRWNTILPVRPNARSFIADREVDWRQGTAATFAILRDGEGAGMVELRRRGAGGGGLLGGLLGPPAGCGHARRAWCCVTCPGRVGHHRRQAHHAADNHASRGGRRPRVRVRVEVLS
ncbi:MAG: GNAT family N-acetyltransferase [Thermoleophilia bacterium]